MDEFDDLKMTESEDDEFAEERVRMVMEEIYKNQDKIKNEQDIEEMAERCTSMMTQMRNDAYLKNKDKKPHRASGSGDKASPPLSRSSKESPRKDSTKPVSTPRLSAAAKGPLKDQIEAKKKQKPNITEMYREKLRVSGKTDLKGSSQNKMDSVKTSKPKVGMGASRKKLNKMVKELSSDSESESTSVTSESDSQGSEDLQQTLETRNTYEKMLKDIKSKETFRGKEAEAHKKTADWMSSTRGEQTKKKEGPGSSSKLSSSKPSQKLPFYSTSEEDSEDEKVAQQLKNKMTMPSKKTPQDSKDSLRKLMASMTDKQIKATATTPKVTPAPLKKATVSSKTVASRPGVSADKAKPKKKI